MSSRTATRVLIGILGLAVVVLGLLLWRASRPSSPVAASKATGDRAQNSHRRGSSGGFAPAMGSRRGPPVQHFNELGQPLNEDGRPIGPSDKLRRIRNKPIPPGEVPMTPPLFDDPSQRAQFKRWWVKELSRRVDAFEKLEPDHDYPSAEETEELLDKLYDAAEPRHPEESVDSAYARRQDWRELWQQFLDQYGVPIKTASSRGGDPQWGETPPPPVEPPGTPDPDVQPEPDTEHQADQSPPGRDPDEPGGTDPVDDEGGEPPAR